jgi:hypothetical protein
MSQFTTPLRTEFDNTIPEKPFVVLESFIYEIGELGSHRSIRVPAGFRTDFASVPRPFRNLFSPAGTYGKAAVIHDYLYNDGYVTEMLIDSETGDTYERHINVSRKEADDIFLEGMIVLGVGWWTRTLIYRAIRFGGRGETWSANGS